MPRRDRRGVDLGIGALLARLLSFAVVIAICWALLQWAPRWSIYAFALLVIAATAKTVWEQERKPQQMRVEAELARGRRSQERLLGRDDGGPGAHEPPDPS